MALPITYDIFLRLDHTFIPEGRGIRAFVRNDSGKRLIDVIVRSRAPDIPIGTLEPREERTIELTWTIYGSYLFLDMYNHTYIWGYNEGKTEDHRSATILVWVGSKALSCKLRFEESKGVPHHPATCTLINKVTGEVWNFDSEPDGTFLIARNRVKDEPVGVDWAVHLSRERAATRESAIGILDPYDWKDYKVVADLAKRHIVTITIKPKSMTTFAQILSEYMPPFLKGVVEVIAGIFGWVSTQVYNLTGQFFGSYLTTVTGGRVVNVEYDFEKGEIRIYTVVMYGSPIVITVTILLAILAIVGIGILAAAFAYSKYTDMRVEELKSERMAQYTETVEVLSKLREEGKITEETFKEAMGSLKEYSDRLEASTPTPTWMEYIPTILIVGLVAVVVIVLIWYATRRAR